MAWRRKLKKKANTTGGLPKSAFLEHNVEKSETPQKSLAGPQAYALGYQLVPLHVE